jgi:hypothetical protein
MSARPGLCGGYHAEWYPYRDRQLTGWEQSARNHRRFPRNPLLREVRACMVCRPSALAWVVGIRFHVSGYALRVQKGPSLA